LGTSAIIEALGIIVYFCVSSRLLVVLIFYPYCVVSAGQLMKVSVLMPVYNAAPYARAAAFSILTQTHKNLELIAIDDGSTVGSSQILEAIASSDRRLRLIARENRGLVASLKTRKYGDLVSRVTAADAILR
jgi:glycosyltransferase involved in cell wall biosynthesis